jgi:hypothetical protein
MKSVTRKDRRPTRIRYRSERGLATDESRIVCRLQAQVFNVRYASLKVSWRYEVRKLEERAVLSALPP